MHFAKLIPYWNSLDSVRRIHSDLEFAALVFFALLVLFDVLAHLSGSKKRERLFERLGLWFFGIAVLAEILAYPYGQRNDELSANVIRSLADSSSRALADAKDSETKSDAANKVAGEAKGKADSASKEADALTIRLAGIKKSVDSQAPRRALLLAAASKIVPLLKPYAGQRVALYACESNRRDPETMDTWGIIAQMLANDKPPLPPDVLAGANWTEVGFFGTSTSEVSTNLTELKTQCGGTGIGISISSEASPRTREAAKALSSSLFAALPRSIYNSFTENKPELAKLLLKSKFIDRTSPMYAQLLDPDLIVLAIEAHPVQ